MHIQHAHELGVKQRLCANTHVCIAHESHGVPSAGTQLRLTLFDALAANANPFCLWPIPDSSPLACKYKTQALHVAHAGRGRGGGRYDGYGSSRGGGRSQGRGNQYQGQDRGSQAPVAPPPGLQQATQGASD